LHHVQPAARAFEETAVNKFAQEFVGVSPTEPKLLPRCDGILSGKHSTSRRDLQDTLDESVACAECGGSAIGNHAAILLFW